MNSVSPTELTDLQWLLLRQLLKYNGPFYTEFLYAQFSKYQIDRLEFYRMFFVLAALNYIQLDGCGELIPGHKQDFCYVVTSKGRKAVNLYTQKLLTDSITSPAAKQLTRKGIATSSVKTVLLKDYVFNH